MQTRRAFREEAKAPEAQHESPTPRGSLLQWASFTFVTFCVAFCWFSRITPSIFFSLIFADDKFMRAKSPDVVKSAALHALIVTFGAAVGVDTHRLSGWGSKLLGVATMTVVCFFVLCALANFG